MTRPVGFEFVGEFLNAEQQAELLRELANLNYHHDSFRGQKLKRSYAQFGFAYVSTGRKLAAVAPFPAFLRSVLNQALPLVPVETELNQCIVTHYPPGAGIGWHTDAPQFGEHILGVSLGGPGRFQLRPNGAKDVTDEIVALPGSLYAMHGPARWDYQHQVVPVRANRFSLTFRSVRPPDPRGHENL